jgi:translation initiation factor RLI1
MIILQIGRTLSNISEVQNYRVRATYMRIYYICSSFPDYFTKLLEDDLKAVVKPQYVDQIPKAVKGPDKTVRTLIESRAQMSNLEEVLDVLGEPFET